MFQYEKGTVRYEFEIQTNVLFRKFRCQDKFRNEIRLTVNTKTSTRVRNRTFHLCSNVYLVDKNRQKCYNTETGTFCKNYRRSLKVYPFIDPF